jgi:aryl-alcohol dehydrogenase-like predicted oxidoreductase
MEYRNLGASALKVSPLCLGTMMFGDQTDEASAGRIVAHALDAGVNFIDTADVYVKGESERIVGKLISPQRDRWVLATKVVNSMGAQPNERGLSRKWIMQAIEASLRRLGSEYVDIYYLHRDFEDQSLEEPLRALGDLIAQGKVRYIGLSNFRAWRVAQAMHLCERMNLPKPICAQPYYNAMNRMPETELLPACRHYGLGVVPYSPLARGVLTGKYTPGAAPAADTRAGRKDKRMMETEFREESMAIAQKIKAHAQARGMSAGDFAVNWVLNNAAVTSVLAGPRTLEQWQAYVGALAHKFTAEDEALVDGLVVTGHPSTPGFNDPQYPLMGRMARVGASGA